MRPTLKRHFQITLSVHLQTQKELVLIQCRLGTLLICSYMYVTVQTSLPSHFPGCHFLKCFWINVLGLEDVIRSWIKSWSHASWVGHRNLYFVMGVYEHFCSKLGFTSSFSDIVCFDGWGLEGLDKISSPSVLLPSSGVYLCCYGNGVPCCLGPRNALPDLRSSLWWHQGHYFMAVLPGKLSLCACWHVSNRMDLTHVQVFSIDPQTLYYNLVFPPTSWDLCTLSRPY